ncbi:Citrate lyase subunit beta [Rodentibacter pneumotropicus]|uniref:Citrate lyase subunit beta n=1 Tax=Rodentibacter pneumotropicus TaxID=758 RepID=A0A448MRB0_9PAST|nr:Citrate lyase subunit beta [Rodentibacter pneumotropicus]
MKLRRSMLFVPGSNAAMLSNSFIYKPDSIMFDLEDAVALKEKIQHAFLSLTPYNIPFIKRWKPLFG